MKNLSDYFNLQKNLVSEIYFTDFYQLSMSLVYILDDIANDEVVFECFIRRVNKEVNPDQDYYIFSGENEVKSFMNNIKNDLNNKMESLSEEFINLVFPKLNKEISEKYLSLFNEKWNNLNIEFQFEVLKEGSIVKPFMPVFQFKGPRWIGQIIETKIVNIVNGKSGLETYKKHPNYNKNDYDEIKLFVQDDYKYNLEQLKNNKSFNKYKKLIRKRAKEYYNSTSKPILEAGFRRSPGFLSSVLSSQIALEENWSGTSNVASYYYGVDIEKIGGSCAHSFIMAYENELDAFKAWLKYFPDSTLLIDTYNVKNAVNLIIENNLNPQYVRIDSDPIDKYAFEVRNLLDKNNKKDLKIFISSDITPEILLEYEKNKVPYDLSMAGTKYVNQGVVEKINCGFVYKLVVNKINGKNVFPEKKSTGKKNYSGYKTINFINNKIVVEKTNGNIGLNDICLANKESEIVFKGF